MVDFRVTAGDVTVPSLAEVMNSPAGSGTVAAPFTFVGQVFGYNSLTDLLAGGPPAFTFDLSGMERTEASFRVQISNTGERRPDLPLTAHTAFNVFAADVAPVPEPGTALLVLAGAAAGLRRLRRTPAARSGGVDE